MSLIALNNSCIQYYHDTGFLFSLTKYYINQNIFISWRIRTNHKLSREFGRASRVHKISGLFWDRFMIETKAYTTDSILLCINLCSYIAHYKTSCSGKNEYESISPTYKEQVPKSSFNTNFKSFFSCTSVRFEMLCIRNTLFTCINVEIATLSYGKLGYFDT